MALCLDFFRDTSSESFAKVEKFVLVAISIFAIVSVEGHLGFPYLSCRFEGLNDVASRPDFTARPDVDSPLILANISIAVHIPKWLKPIKLAFVLKVPFITQAL